MTQLSMTAPAAPPHLFGTRQALFALWRSIRDPLAPHVAPRAAARSGADLVQAALLGEMFCFKPRG